MRKAEHVLETLGNISKQHPDYVFRRVYRELFNRDLFLRAYLKLAPNEGNMTKGTDGRTIDGFGMKLVDEIIDELKNERYHPKPARREYIPKSNGKMRPLGIPTFRDKLVQEALREILEAIYEPIFSDCSHGFRPERSCHTALTSIQYGCSNTSWVVEGDITSFFDNIDHETLLGLISEKVDDGRVTELIRRFLKAGYVEDGSFRLSELGSPQGGVLSPLLANIYLHEFDKFAESMKAEYGKGTARKPNKVYLHWKGKRIRALKRGDLSQAMEAFKQMQKVPCGDPMDDGFVRIRYCRYADDWCFFIIGNKRLASELKDRASMFLKEKLKLELNESKTHITNMSDDNVRFLGYEIAKMKVVGKFHKSANGTKMRNRNGTLTLLMPREAISERISKISVRGKAAPRNDLLQMSVEEIIRKYASEINGVYNYYCLASNVSSRMHHLRIFHYQSLLRTIAKKEKSSVRKVLRKYGSEVGRADGKGTHVAICVMEDGKRIAWYPYDGFRKRKFVPKPRSESITEFGKELNERISRNECEVCTSSERVEVHHVRNLKQTVERYTRRKNVPNWVSLMENMGRKTLVLCHDCHNKLHANKLIIPNSPWGSPMH